LIGIAFSVTYWFVCSFQIYSVRLESLAFAISNIEVEALMVGYRAYRRTTLTSTHTSKDPFAFFESSENRFKMDVAASIPEEQACF
jgi:hypothetical protein